MNPVVPREKWTHLSQINGNLNCMNLSVIDRLSHIGTYLIGTQSLIYTTIIYDGCQRGLRHSKCLGVTGMKWKETLKSLFFLKYNWLVHVQRLAMSTVVHDRLTKFICTFKW